MKPDSFEPDKIRWAGYCFECYGAEHEALLEKARWNIGKVGTTRWGFYTENPEAAKEAIILGVPATAKVLQRLKLTPSAQ
jgi:hypothetical protein